MRRRAAAAAAAAAASGGDAVTRRRRVVRYFGSTSASGAPTTSDSEACCRPQASVYLFYIVLLRGCTVLTFVFVCHAGTKPRSRSKDRAMERAPWKYGEKKLDGQAALKVLHVGRPREVVDMKDYCLNMPAISWYTVPGAIAQKQEDGSSHLEDKALMAEPAQELSRAALLFLDVLFSAGHCLRTIRDTSLKVEVGTGTVQVLLSKEASETDVIPTTTADQVDHTIACLANKLQDYIFTQNNISTAHVPEVQAFFCLMAEPGSNKMWHAIVNNAALVPLENLREYYIRMFEQLHYVVRSSNHNDFNHILEELVFPLDWHTKISRDSNGVLFILYGGGVYDATAVTKREQAEQITKMFRNSGVHVLDRMAFHVGRSDVCLVQCSLAPLLYSSLAKALQQRQWLVSSNVHTLFVYTHRSL